MDTLSSPLVTTPKDQAAQLLEDLAVLCDGPAIDMRFSFDGALITMRSHDMLVWQESAEARWMRQDPRARADMLARWIHEAAETYRQLLRSRRGDSRKGVA